MTYALILLTIKIIADASFGYKALRRVKSVEESVNSRVDAFCTTITSQLGDLQSVVHDVNTRVKKIEENVR